MAEAMGNSGVSLKIFWDENFRFIVGQFELPLALASGIGLLTLLLGFSPTIIKTYTMSYVKVYIHLVWSTKSRHPFLDSIEKREAVWQHILNNAKQKNIFIDFVNGHKDHCHCLVSLGVDQTIKDVVQMIKGESSFWINNLKLCSTKFQWQNDYFAASVSESLINKTRDYIKNQEEHHKKKTFVDEYNEFLLAHGFERFLD